LCFLLEDLDTVWSESGIESHPLAKGSEVLAEDLGVLEAVLALEMVHLGTPE